MIIPPIKRVLIAHDVCHTSCLCPFSSVNYRTTHCDQLQPHRNQERSSMIYLKLKQTCQGYLPFPPFLFFWGGGRGQIRICTCRTNDDNLTKGARPLALYAHPVQDFIFAATDPCIEREERFMWRLIPQYFGVSKFRANQTHSKISNIYTYIL